MKNTAKRLLTAACSIMVMLTCIFLSTSCSGVEITPGEDGSIVITPTDGEEGNNGIVKPDDDKDDSNDDSQNQGTIHTHSYEAVESPDSTYSCTEGGVRIWLCSCGDSFRETAVAPGHEIRSYEGKPATCLEDGYEPYEKCIRGSCDYTTYKAIPALGHNLKYYVDIQPTCTVDGAYDKEECTREGCNYTSQKTIAATGHSWERVEGKPATCTEAGYLSYNVCTVTGCESSVITPPAIDPLGHDDIHYEGKEPTCTEFGWIPYDVCQRCSRSTYIKMDATSHRYSSTSNGSCDICGYFDSGTHKHFWIDSEIIEEATCTAPGSMKQTCTNISCKDTQVIEIHACGHNTISYEAKAPTCTNDGYYSYEACKNCSYSTYSVDPATGHSYDNGVVTTHATCTQPGIRTYSCVNGNCDKTVITEVEKLGHDWGNWFVSVEATCTTSGQEQRKCFNDSEHIDYRTITKLGHDWTEYSVVKKSTCTEEGQKKRTCNNDISHEEIVIIPVEQHDVVLSTGICNICKKVINQPLETPVITSFNNYVIFWNAVEGADHYEVRVVYNGQEVFKPINSLNFSLEKYFRECSSLDVYLRAMSPEGSTTPHSAYYQETYSVADGNIADYEGVGKTVNLLTNTYTNYGTGTISIFNQYMFNRLMAGDEVALAGADYKHFYTESISEYTNKLTTSIGTKISEKSSIGIDKLFKVTCGYSFEINDTYTKKTYNQTQAVFYDAYYEYRGYQGGIEGFSDPQVLYTILSDEFIRDAEYLQNGEMSPEAFINRYGTHVITAGIYGAKFNAHYEMIANKETLENNNKLVTEANITAGIESVFEGIKVGADADYKTTFTIEDFISSANSEIVKVFEISTVGGNHTAPSITPSDFDAISQSWADSMTKSDYVLIDVPDGSLYFVWDFLGDEYADVKKTLNDYFYARCDEQLDALNNKINGMYKDFFNFDYETGTLTFDLSALQEPETATTSLKDVLYMDGNAEIFNGSTGKFTIYSKFNGYDVNKVVFEGAYLTRESQQNRLIDAYFDGIYIVFDEGWTADRDIEVEFKNFAYHAPEGHSALDFSAISSENITVIATGEVHIEGKMGVNGDGGTAILATDKNITVSGTGNMTVKGSKGYDGISGGSSGKRGANGIIVNNLYVNISGNFDVYGGNGGNGAVGSPDNVDDSDGGNGGTGGSGGYAIQGNSIQISNTTAIITGGNGGDGGRGGHGNNKDNVLTAWPRNGGHGGDGGHGNWAVYVKTVTVINSSITIVGGRGGNGGAGGGSGKYGPDGDGGNGGYGGDGGIAVSNTIINSLDSKVVVLGGNGGSGGSGTDGGAHGASGANAYIKAEIYIGNKCYALYETAKTWTDAKSSAENNGAYLATITSEQEQQIINELVSHGSLRAYFIGGYRDVNGDNAWEWVTGEEFSFTDWGSGQPDNNNTSEEDRIEIERDSLSWNDNTSNAVSGYIQERDLVFDDNLFDGLQ